MKKYIYYIAIIAIISLGALYATKGIKLGENGTINTLDQFTSTTTPLSAITQRTYGKALKITGLTTGLCLTLSSQGILGTTACGTGSSGTVSTSTAETAGQVAFWTSTSATPATLGSDSSLYWDSTNHRLGVGGTPGTAKLYVNGAVGLGTTTPTNKLTITDTTAPQLSLSTGAGISQWTMRNAGGNLYFASTTVAGTATSTGAPALTILNNGNVGVGTGSPASLLQIGSGNLTWSTDGGGDIGMSGGNRPNNIYAKNSLQTSHGSALGAALTVAGGGNQTTIGSSGMIFYNTGMNIKWNGVNTGISYLSNGVIGIGNGTAGDYSGTLIASNVGIGTTTPSVKLDISVASSTAGTNQTNPFARLVEMTIAGVWYMIDSFDYYGHLITGGPTPAVSSCGTSPSIQGNDRNFRVYVGSVSASSCTVTFAKPYVNPPICTVTPEVGSMAFAPLASSTPSGIVISGGTITSAVFVGHCEGWR